MLLILAGSETSASTLTNALAFLGLHRPAWERLVDEQRRMQAKHGNQLTKDALDKECPYLDAVIRETMRIRPLSGGIPRIAKETILLQGQQIPKGWFVDWSAALSHELDPKTFKEDGSHMDVMKGFQPDRWLSEETAPVDYVPMGAGPRYCLGSNLAYVEMKVFLAVLARSLDFELAQSADDSTEGLVWKRMSIIPKVENGVPVRVRPLQGIPSPMEQQVASA
jgi:cytochrome P450